MWIIKDFKNTSTAGSIASMENSPHAENDAAVANQNVITPTNTSTTAKMEKKPRRRKQILANFLRDFNVFQLQSNVSSTDLKLKGAFKMGKFGDILSCESPNYIVKRFYLDAIDEKLLRREISIHCK